MTTAGTVTEFEIPTAGSQPVGITAGPDGNLWFAKFGGSKIGRITIDGMITEFSGLFVPAGIVAGSDGNLWFGEVGNSIGRITTAGAITEFPVPTANGQPVGIAAGPDGALWFTEYVADKIGRITTSTAREQLTAITPTGHKRTVAPR